MAIEIIDKLKQKNGGNFKLIDAVDVEMKDGSDLETYLENMEVESEICEVVVYKGDKPPDDESIIIWDDTSEENEYTGNIGDSVIEEFKYMFKFMQDQILELKKTIVIHESRIAYLELNGGGVETPDESSDVILTFEDGNILTFEDGLSMIFEDNEILTKDKLMMFETGEILTFEDGTIMILESNEVITNDTLMTFETRETMTFENEEIMIFEMEE